MIYHRPLEKSINNYKEALKMSGCGQIDYIIESIKMEQLNINRERNTFQKYFLWK